MNIVLVMLVSILIKGISAIVEIAIQMLITNHIGISGYGDYTFYVSMIEFAYYFLFSGSVKLNTFYLSTQTTSIQSFKKKYVYRFVAPITLVLFSAFVYKKSSLGCVSTIILLIYFFTFDRSSVFYSRGTQLPALLGEFLIGRLVMLSGLIILLKLNAANGIRLLLLYGLQFLVILIWYLPFGKKLLKGTDEVLVSINKLWQYQKTEVAFSLISYSPTILQYAFAGSFTAGFTGIISIIKKFINFISGPTAKVFLPEFSRLYKDGNKEQLQQTYIMIVRIQMVFIATIGSVLIGFSSLILRLFSPELQSYSLVFTIAAICLLVIAGMGPVTGFLQMTGSEKICNRNQWASIGVMVLVWLVLSKYELFAVYGLIAQAITEGTMKYISMCKWFGKSIIPIKDYGLMWLPVILCVAVVKAFSLQNSLALMIVCALIVCLWNAGIALSDPMVKAATAGIIKRIKN